MEFKEEDLKYSEDLPETKNRVAVEKIAHWGQRKLCISEIEFFSLYWNREEDPNPLVLYVGAAPGQHFTLLASMFPSFSFILYDPAEFAIKPTDNIKIHRKFFTDQIAEGYRGKISFFLSDIRIDDYHKKNARDLEDSIENDMNAQARWTKLINPRHALLKFRLRWPTVEPFPTQQRYLAGTVYWQPWTPKRSPEARLVPERNEEGEYYDKAWDLTKYDDIALYHNTITRQNTIYLNPYAYDSELTNDYDSTAEGKILEIYVKNIMGIETNLRKTVVSLSKEVTLGSRTKVNYNLATTRSTSDKKDFMEELADALVTRNLGKIREYLISDKFVVDDTQFRWKVNTFHYRDRLHNDSGLLMRAAVGSGSHGIVKLILCEDKIDPGAMDNIALQDALISGKNNIAELLAASKYIKSPGIYNTQPKTWTLYELYLLKLDISDSKYPVNDNSKLLREAGVLEKWLKSDRLEEKVKEYKVPNTKFHKALLASYLETEDLLYLRVLCESVSMKERQEKDNWMKK